MVALVLISIIIGISFCSRSLASPRHTEQDEIKMLALHYYDAISNGDYDEVFSLLYRSNNTLFTDDFIITGSIEEPLSHYKVNTVSKLSEKVFVVTGSGQVAGENLDDITNYAIYLDGKYYFVIHWTDVPPEMYDFSKIIGY